MELFDILKSMFESPGLYSDVTKSEKRKNFFMINRRLSINFPIQANLLQHMKINMESSIDWWQRFLRKQYTKTPYWMFLAGVKKVKEEKEKKVSLSGDLISDYCRFYNKDSKQIKYALQFFPDEMTREIKEYDKMRKQLN